MDSKNIIVTSGRWHYETAGGAYKATMELAGHLADQGTIYF
jgi:hypothetical protein